MLLSGCSASRIVPSRRSVIRLSGEGEVLAGKPEVDRVPRDLAVGCGRSPPEPARRRALDLPVVGLAEHLDVAHRVRPSLAGAVEVVEGQRLLEDRRIGFAGEGDEGQVVMPQVVPADLVRGVREAMRMPVAGRLQQKGGRQDGPRGQHDDVGGEGVRGAVRERRGHAGDRAAAGVGQQPLGRRAGHQGQVGMRGQGRADHGPFGVGLGAERAGESVNAVAPYASRVRDGPAVRVLGEMHPQRQVKRVQAQLGQAIGQLLDARLVPHRRVGVVAARGAGEGVLAVLAVHPEQVLGADVIRLHVVVAQRPGRRDPVRVPDLAEVGG